MVDFFSKDLFETFQSMLNLDLDQSFSLIGKKNWNTEEFKFATAVSVMSSSRIEGEALAVDSYVKHKLLKVDYLPELIERPNDLFNAYEFARDNGLSRNNIFEVHRILSKHLLPEENRGRIRSGNMIVFDQQSQTVKYEAAHASIVHEEMELFFNELDELLQSKLTTNEVFYFASLIHLVFVKIHPFDDGNGRTARLLEKWFLSAHLGENAWFVPSESNYFNTLSEYYHNLALVGMYYDQLDYGKSLPFLLMTTKAMLNHFD